MVTWALYVSVVAGPWSVSGVLDALSAAKGAGAAGADFASEGLVAVLMVKGLVFGVTVVVVLVVVDVVRVEEVRGVGVALGVRVVVVGVTVDTERGDRLDNEVGEDRDVEPDAMVGVGILFAEPLGEVEDTVDRLVGGTRDEIGDEINELLSDVYEEAKRLFVGALDGVDELLGDVYEEAKRIIVGE